MTWVFGWPLEIEWAVKYAKQRKLCPDGVDDVKRLYYAAGHDITRRLGVAPSDVPVLSCWDGDDPKAVYALNIDRKAKTLEQARVRFRKLPPQSLAIKLAGLLDAHHGPRWYEYGGGSAYDSCDSDSDSDSDAETIEIVIDVDETDREDESDSDSESTGPESERRSVAPGTLSLSQPKYCEVAVQKDDITVTGAKVTTRMGELAIAVSDGATFDTEGITA
ncbi:hypothetical protein CERSUDRAFT_113814 [Gelatoporia subvermispora B]|uniref:Uncharacterized protein n=1 Tax=Ceriporiopsis subvermispora (strain B) TaxID=914234 RepID=M2RIK3_CERS8|nr:hypothetical protein CERSUDRAFT_113814 [Gelatoporia subvermispora B]